MSVHDPYDTTVLPFDADAHDPRAPQKPRPAVLGEAFPYIGKGCTLAQFSEYIQTYNFGKVPPDHVIFHHTANPDASYAPLSSNPATRWDRNEAGMSISEMYYKRKRQLDGLKSYYEKTLGWSAGPHIFIDDRWIWLMTPMYDVGIHAKWGNSFRSHGRLHYSIGIEVIGYYERREWPAPVQALVGGAVRALQAQLGTFSLDYMYQTDDSKPGMKVAKGVQVCAHPERLKFGGLASHADYNKPQCPGAAITPDFYTKVCRS